MPDDLTNCRHLPDILIRNFRGVEYLTIDRLGRVTLLVGDNGLGKSTVLEAVRVYAARADPRVLREVLQKRGEIAPVLDEDQDLGWSPNYASLFYGRTLTRERSISIGPQSGADVLRLQVSRPSHWSGPRQALPADLPQKDDVRAVNVMYQDRHRMLPWLADSGGGRANSSRGPYRMYRHHKRFDEEKWPSIECNALGPGLPDDTALTHLWNSVELNECERLSLQALRLTRERVERVELVGDDRLGSRKQERQVVVMLKGYPHPVPLRSLGEGVTRLVATRLALSGSCGGFLVVDEAENGIHYSIQRDYWSMVLRAARKHDVQVLATTHSWDCVKGFARAVSKSPETEGALVRLSRIGNQVRTVEYTTRNLQIATRQGIEVR